ncbi:hypothetical protein DL95DRAFT_386179, partial [Leptodontidium sp. 2 PMI_412]
MRSHLTPSVFRRLLSNEGLIFHCPSRTALLSRHSHRHASPHIIRAPGRRHLFGFSHKPPRQPKEPSIAPGLKPMLDLSLMDKINAKPPPAQELVKAWRAFFKYKVAKKEPLNNLQAQHALRVYQHLQKLDSEDPDCKLTWSDLKAAWLASSFIPEGLPVDPDDSLAKLARLLHAEWQQPSAKDTALQY